MTEPTWRRSTRCGSGSCAEVVVESGRVLVRNSRRPDVVVEFDRDEWTAFLAGAEAGEFQLS